MYHSTHHASSLGEVQSNIEESLVDVIIIRNLLPQSRHLNDAGTQLSVAGKLGLNELKPSVLVLLDPYDVVHHLELLLEGEGEDWLHLQGEGNHMILMSHALMSSIL